MLRAIEQRRNSGNTIGGTEKLWRKFLEINAFNFGSHYQRGQARPSIRSKEFWHHYWGDAKAHWPVSVFWTLMIIIEAVFAFWLIWNPEVYGIKSQTVSWQGAVLGGWCLTAVVVWLPLSLREGLRRRDSGVSRASTKHTSGAEQKCTTREVIGQRKCPRQLFGRSVAEAGWQQAG